MPIYKLFPFVYPPVLSTIIKAETSDKFLCTRALWCIANQSFKTEHLKNVVPMAVGVASEVMTSHRFDTPVVDAEALNILIRYTHLQRITSLFLTSGFDNFSYSW